MRVPVTCAALAAMALAAFPASAQFTSQQLPPQADQIQPYESQQIPSARPDRVRPDRGERVRPERGERARQDRGGAPRNEAVVDTLCKTADQSPQQMLGRWTTFVPGAVIETARGAEVGIAGGGAVLMMSQNGLYEWGNVSGKWKKSTEGDGWPVVLTKARDGKDWKLSLDGDTCELLLWDGLTHLRGKRVH